VSPGSTFAPDAAMVLGIAATAMPFAEDPEAEAERWLRLLRLHGDVGVVLQALGVDDEPLRGAGRGPDGGAGAAVKIEERDVVAHVTASATRIARERGGPAVTTADVLRAVMDVYGESFDRLLRAHGTDREEVLARLGVR
jgi:hypothetical protein